MTPPLRCFVQGAPASGKSRTWEERAAEFARPLYIGTLCLERYDALLDDIKTYGHLSVQPDPELLQTRRREAAQMIERHRARRGVEWTSFEVSTLQKDFKRIRDFAAVAPESTCVVVDEPANWVLEVAYEHSQQFTPPDFGIGARLLSFELYRLLAEYPSLSIVVLQSVWGPSSGMDPSLDVVRWASRWFVGELRFWLPGLQIVDHG